MSVAVRLRCLGALLAALAGPAAALAGADQRDTRPTTRAVARKALLEELRGRGGIIFNMYNRGRRWDISAVNADGGNIHNIFKAKEARRLYFERAIARGMSLKKARFNFYKVGPTEDVHDNLPRIAPGGRRLYFVRIGAVDPNGKLVPFANVRHRPWSWGGHLYVTDLAGAKPKPVTFLGAGARGPVTEASGLAVIDDNTVVYGDCWSQRIVVLNVKTGRRTLYPVKGPPKHIAASPDGQEIWYAAPQVGWRLYRLDRRTGTVHDMGGSDFCWPAVSHDGTKIVHTAQNRPELTGGIADRCIVIRDRAKVRWPRLLIGEKGSEFSCPAWGPGDKYLVYAVRKGGPVTLRVTRLSDVVTVPVNTDGNWIDPCWVVPAKPTSRPAGVPPHAAAGCEG